MRMLRWMCGATKKDNTRNEHVRGSVKVAPVTKKITEKKVKWYGHVKRRVEGHMLGKMLDAQERVGEEDRQPFDLCKRDMDSVLLKEDDALERIQWKNHIQHHDFGNHIHYDRKSVRRRRPLRHHCHGNHPDIIRCACHRVSQ